MDDDKPTLTTSAGNAIVDNQNSMTAGPRGHVLLQDYQLLEKLAHQNRERIPERTVHAKGWGAFGTFTVTHDITSDYPKWRLFVQVMPEPDAGKTPYNPFDLTKVWPHGDYPLIEAGLLELNRNPENYFAEIEQAAFSPSNIVPGIGFSPDKMLQARIFSYPDAHRHRLGTHYEALPVNAPKCPCTTTTRMGRCASSPTTQTQTRITNPTRLTGRSRTQACRNRR